MGTVGSAQLHPALDQFSWGNDEGKKESGGDGGDGDGEGGGKVVVEFGGGGFVHAVVDPCLEGGTNEGRRQASEDSRHAFVS